MTITKQCQQSNIDNDGNNNDGGDGNSGGDRDGDGDSDGDGDNVDAAAVNSGDNIDDNGSSIQGWQLDNSNRTMTMGQ
jgi:hypothetical protein